MKRFLPFIIIGATLLVVVGVGWTMMRSRRSAEGTPALPKPAPTPAGRAKTTSTHVVTIDEYGDYQCPPCGLLYPELKKIESEYGSSIRIVFHHFPLTKVHKNALAAAHAAEAAARQNHFWEMHDRLYLNQKAWSEEPNVQPIFVAYARDLGLDTAKFTADMDSKEVDEKISYDVKQAEAIGITATPTLVLDGNELRTEATTPQGIRRAIDYLHQTRR
jgi:protein-disulfide isomerase